MPGCGLTVDREENPAFQRVSVDARRPMKAIAGHPQGFPQNISVTFD
jgi:hypothetical protein